MRGGKPAATSDKESAGGIGAQEKNQYEKTRRMTITVGDRVSIVPIGQYHIGHYYKMVRMEEIHINPDKHTLEGPWEVVRIGRKHSPHKAALSWPGTKFITHVRVDFLVKIEEIDE